MTPLDWTHAVRDVPGDGLPVERTATVDELQRLADALRVVSVDQLAARYRLTPRPGGRLALSGVIDARVTQECVVTLDPVASSISIPLDVIFTSQASTSDPAIEGSLDDLESPDEEPIENGAVDVGRIVLEELLSGIDPYPRLPEASFDWSDTKGDPAAEKPFAALARLRKPQGPD
ncbi:MAG: DUF177 domain-containing protein [Hyphomicrobiaceae bacterium]